ncbi:MAG TPA: hypothetical protein VGB38_06100 [bacterium]
MKADAGIRGVHRVGSFLFLALVLAVVLPLTASAGSAAKLRVKGTKTLGGYSEGISCMSISPQGLLYISAKNSSKIDVWNLVEMKQVNQLEGHRDKVRSLAVSESGQFVVSSSDDNTLRVWPVGTQGEAAVLQGPEKGFAAVAISADDRLVAGALDEAGAEIWLWKRGSNEEPVKLKGPGTADGILKEPPKAVRQMRFSPFGTGLAAVTGDGLLITWSIETGTYDRVHILPPDMIKTVDINGQGDILACCHSFKMTMSAPSYKITLSKMHGSILYVPSGSERKESSDSAPFIAEGAFWLGDGRYFLLYASRGARTPLDHFLRLVPISSVLDGRSLEGDAEVKLKDAPLYMDVAASRDGSIFVQSVNKQLLVWQLELELPTPAADEKSQPVSP